ncbi:uncharacterized protein LOC8283167 isoform X2 [Ricinus communis]|uniref:uncharacterized protein LOC8283167 isoform X2 n=1 Tax=Ricinus communis TaxID=3988 RepID=UPI00201A4F85|nr:uncharacterized protein LOC8283167 isoform X2 [Ricinus communis]
MDFESMKRKELQSLCKKHCIPANLTNLEMANRLTEIFKAKENLNSKEGNENNFEEEDNATKMKLKKVRFSPDVETREYEVSAYAKPVRRTSRRTTVPKESEESNLVGKKREKGNDGKVESVSVSRATRSRAVVDKEETSSSVVEKKIETVRGKRGLRSKKIDKDSVEEEKATGNEANSIHYEVMEVERVCRVTRSSASAVEGKVLGAMKESKGVVRIKDSLKGLGMNVSTGKTVARFDGKVGSNGQEVVLKDTRKRSRNVDLEVMTQVNDFFATKEVVEKASSPSAVCPRRSRRKTTVFNSAVVISDESGAGEPVGKRTRSNGTVSGKGVCVTDEPRRSTRNSSRQATSSKTAQNVGKVGQARKSRRKTILSSTVANDETGAGEVGGKAKELNENASGKGAYVTDEPRRSKRNAYGKSSGAISSDMNDSVEIVGKVRRESKKCETVQETETAVIVEESLIGKTPRRSKRHAFKSELPGASVPHGCIEKKQENLPTVPIVMKETMPEIISGKGAINEPRRSKRNASRLHLTATSNETNVIAENVGNVGLQDRKSGTTQETETAVVADDFSGVFFAPVEKQHQSISKIPRRSTRSVSRQHLAATSDEMDEFADGKDGQQHGKSGTVQEPETVVVDELVGNTPRQSTQHAFKSNLVRSSALTKSVDKKQQSISGVPFMMKETTPTNFSGEGVYMTDESRRFTRSASKQHLAATSSEMKEVTESVKKVGQGNKKCDAVEETETVGVVNKLVGNSRRQSARHAFKNDLVRFSALRKSAEKKQQSLSRVPVTMKKTTPTNISGGVYMTDESLRSTRNPSKKHLAATSCAMDEVAETIGKVGQRNEKCDTVEEMETAVVVNELVGNAPRLSTRNALKDNLIRSSVHGKSVEKQQSISRVPIIMKKTSPANISPEGIYMTDDSRRYTRSVSKQRLAATFSAVNEVAESVGQGNEKCDTVEKTETAVVGNEVGKTPRQSTRHAFKSDLIGSSVPVGKKQESILRLPIIVRKTTPINISPPIEDTGLITAEATGERKRLFFNSNNAKAGDSTEEVASKVAGDSVVVNGRNIVLMNDTGNGISDGSIEDSADLDNHDSAKVKLAEFQAKACDIISPSDGFSSVNHSALAGESLNLLGFEKVPAKEEMISGKDACCGSDDTSNYSAEVDRISIEGGVCGLERSEQENTKEETEDILGPGNVRSTTFSAKSIIKSCSEDVCQETDDVNNCSTEVERVPAEDDEATGPEWAGRNDTLDTNDHGAVTHDRQASPALIAKTIVEEIEDMHHECDDVNHQNYSATTVALTSPDSGCFIPKVNDDNRQASGSKLSFFGNFIMESSEKHQVCNFVNVADEKTIVTDSDDEDLKDALEGIPADALPHELEDEKISNNATAKKSKAEILCQQDVGDCIVGERGISFNNNGGELFLLEASAPRNLDFPSEKFHNHKEIVVDRNCSVDVVMHVPVTEYCNPVRDNVEQQQMEGKNLDNCVVPELGVYGGSLKIAAEVNSASDSSFSWTICQESSDSHIAIKEVISSELNTEQCDQVLRDGTAECASVMKLSDRDGEEVATSLTQSRSIQQSEYFEGKNVELNSLSPRNIKITDGMKEKRDKLEVSDSKVYSFLKFMNDPLDAEEAPEVHDGNLFDGIFRKDEAAENETCMMPMDQQAQEGGTSESNSTGKPVKVISNWTDGLLKVNAAARIALSGTASIDFGGLYKDPDGVEKHAVEVHANDSVHVKAVDAKGKDGKLEGNLEGKDTGHDAEKELDENLLSFHEEAADGGTLLSVFLDDTSHEMTGTELQRTTLSCSQWEDNMPTEILSFADAYLEQPEIDSGSSSLQQNAKSNEEFEEQLKENNVVIIGENDGAQRVGENLTDPTDSSSLGENVRDHHEVTKEQLDVQKDPVNKVASVDNNDGLTLKELPCDDISKISPAEAGELQCLHKPDDEVLTAVSSKQAAEFEKLDDISLFQHEVVADDGSTSAVCTSPDHGGEDVELHLLFAEGEEYNVEEPGSQALDRKLHKNEIFTEQDAKQVAEDQQEKDMLMEDVGEALELMEGMLKKGESTGQQSLAFTNSMVGQDSTAGTDQSCHPMMFSPDNPSSHPETKELELYGEQLTCSVMKRKTSRSVLIQMTLEKVLDCNAMKENAPSMKTDQPGNVTALKSLAKRRPLEDLRNY